MRRRALSIGVVAACVLQASPLASQSNIQFFAADQPVDPQQRTGCWIGKQADWPAARKRQPPLSIKHAVASIPSKRADAAPQPARASAVYVRSELPPAKPFTS